jgi:DNA polymerase-3 subunit beta
MADQETDGDFQLKKGVILPKKGLHELKKLLVEVSSGGEEKPKADLGFAENSAIFRRLGLVLVMRLIEGLFPDYQQVIPKTGEKAITLGRARLLDTLRRVSLLSSDKAYAVKIELSQGRLTVLSQNPDLGDAKEEVPIDYQGDPLKIGFNARYLIDVLQVLKTDDVILELADDLSPCVIKASGDPNYTAVVMPMRI